MNRSELSPVLVSACLLGQPVRYDGRASGHPDVLQGWQAVKLPEGDDLSRLDALR